VVAALEGVLRRVEVNAWVAWPPVEADLSTQEVARLGILEVALQQEVEDRECAAASPVHPVHPVPWAAFPGWASVLRWSEAAELGVAGTWSWTEPQIGPELSLLRM